MNCLPGGSIFSHELAEACTDPEGSAILGTTGTCSRDGWCEIGDVCEGVNTIINGVTVQKYWSQRDRACIVQSAWESPGGVLISPPTVVSQTANSLDLFGLGMDNAVWHTSWNGTGWEGWKSLEGTFISPTSAVSWAENQLDLFALGMDNSAWHKGWDGNNWSGWESLGGILTGAISVVPQANPGFQGIQTDPQKSLDLFALGQDHAIWHKWGGQSFWEDWESLGGTFISSPSAVSWATNRLDVFVPGTDHAVWHKWWDGASWGGWESLGGSVFSVPTVVSGGLGRLHLFALGADGTVCYKGRGSTGWGGWESLGGFIFSASSPIYWGWPSRLDLFALGTESDVWHRWWG